MGQILVIDDVNAVLSLLRKTLTRVGYKVITACDGKGGIGLLRSLRRTEWNMVARS